MDDYRQQVGERLLALRRERHWNQEDAAHAIGVAVKTWGNWERGQADPYESNWRRIGEVFERDPSEIRGSQPPAPDPFPARDDVDQQLDRIEAKVSELPVSKAATELRDLVRDLRAQRQAEVQEWRGDLEPWRDDIAAWRDSDEGDERLAHLEAHLTEIKALLLVQPDDRQRRYRERQWAKLRDQLERDGRDLPPEERRARQAEAERDFLRAVTEPRQRGA